jgi:hypothetical protein
MYLGFIYGIPKNATIHVKTAGKPDNHKADDYRPG